LFVGIFINYFIEFPWEGLTYALDNFQIEATREDITFGIKRLAGFSRTHVEAAIQMLWLIVFLIVHIKNRFIKISVWLLGGLVIIFTTSKGIILSYLLISILLILYKLDYRMISYYKVYRKLLLSLLITGILLPIITYVNILVIDLKLNDDLNKMMFTSFTMRIYDLWPEAIELILDHGNILLGRGLGGIGTSQIFFETYLYNPVDNIFLFLYANFGLLGGLYLIYLYYKGRLLKLNEDLYFCLLLLFIFQYGITTSLFDDYLISLCIGFLLMHFNNARLRLEYQTQLAKINNQI